MDRPVFLHNLAIAPENGAVYLTGSEPWRAVHALNGLGTYFPALCNDMASEFLTPGGLDGVPYLGSLGPAGTEAHLATDQQATYLLVATYATTPPRIEQISSAVKVISYKLVGLNRQRTSNVYNLKFSDGSEGIYSRRTFLTASPVGYKYDDLQNGGGGFSGYTDIINPLT